MSEPVTSAPARPRVKVGRTILQVLIAVSPFVPELIDSLGVSRALPGVALLLAFAGAITRAFNTRAAEVLLRKYAPWLAARDIDVRKVVAHTTDSGVVVAGEASTVPTGQILRMPTVESVRRKPARRRRATEKATPDAGDADLTTVLVVLAIVVLVLIIADRI